MRSNLELRDGRRLSEDSRSSHRVRERKSKGDAMVRRETEPPRRLAGEAPPPAIAILLLGLSGVGKSTFISHLTQERMQIGHSLTSCTKDVDGYSYIRSDGQQVYLLDTPGFDDTEADNICVLQKIAMLLNTIYDSGCIRLAGVLYLHRISDVRMAGSSVKSIRLIEKICGESNFGAVSIVTTMWELVEPDVAGNREQSLISTPHFFGRLAEGGATIIRHLNTFDSAVNIVEHILRKQQSAILDIQREMIVERKSLENTAAGQYLGGEFEQMRARYEQELEQLQEALEDAMQDNDDDLVTIISEQRREYEANILMAKLAQDQLATTPEQMEQQRMEWFAQKAKEAERATWEAEEKTPREIELEEQLARAEMEHIRELNKLRLANKGKAIENEKLKKEHRKLKETVKEQLYRERAEREKKDPRAELAEVMGRGFVALLQGAFGGHKAITQPLRRALTFPRAEKPLKLPQGSKTSDSKGRSSSQHQKPRKKKHGKQVPEDDFYEGPDEESYSSSNPDENPVRRMSQHAVPYAQAAAVAAASSHQQRVQPGFENVNYVQYPVDPSSYSRKSTSIALARAYPSSSQQQ
ncbi:hypothetical protein K458DRAFT_382157 [Lentithecium fluviatile CBS 122367]|uniref:G domain-containing protein n=1 Tax=Lentithecium fluviatile CBS 122367 TaxID=1168545 RepID=A0A6G1JKC9_9PLEO|nr:hypothetical protein K458DRAFT_382157 [Lentithecium fluviatile CBS 122367]